MMVQHSDEAVKGRLLKARDLAAQLGTSTGSIYRKRSLGEPLPVAVKVGKSSIRWRQADVDAWLEQHLEGAD